jgi:hypothetical protein
MDALRRLLLVHYGKVETFRVLYKDAFKALFIISSWSKPLGGST